MKKIEEFINKSVSDRPNDGVDRNKMEKESREKVLREINVFRKKQVSRRFSNIIASIKAK